MDSVLIGYCLIVIAGMIFVTGIVNKICATIIKVHEIKCYAECNKHDVTDNNKDA